MIANIVLKRNEVGMVLLRDAVMVLVVLQNVHIHTVRHRTSTHVYQHPLRVYSLLYASATRFSPIPRALWPWSMNKHLVTYAPGAPHSHQILVLSFELSPQNVV